MTITTTEPGCRVCQTDPETGSARDKFSLAPLLTKQGEMPSESTFAASSGRGWCSFPRDAIKIPPFRRRRDSQQSGWPGPCAAHSNKVGHQARPR